MPLAMSSPYILKPLANLPLNYIADVMSDSPAGYWYLNETSGTTAIDYSGNGRNGTYTIPGGTIGSVQTGPFGIGENVFDLRDAPTTPPGQLPLENTGNYIRIPDATMDATIGAPAQSWTFEAWINTEISTGGFRGIVDKTDIAAPNWNVMWVNPTGGDAGRINMQTWDGVTNPGGAANSDVFVQTPGALSPWYHLAMVRATVGDGGADELRSYINGVLQSSYPIAAPGGMDTTNARDLCIGAHQEGTSNFFPGFISHVAVYFSAVPTARLLSHYTIGTTTP